MRFDDRLATLLTLPVVGAHDRAVRWRQLVELAARAGREDEHGAPFIAALAVIRADAKRVSRDVRTAAARSIAGRSLALPLLEVFAEDELAVAAPVFAGRKLGKAQLKRLLEIADPEVQAFLVTLNPGVDDDAERLGISDIVARLDHPVEPPAPTQQAEEATEWPVEPAVEPDKPAPQESAGPVQPFAEDGVFQWETNASGEIGWVEGIPRGAVIGLSIASTSEVGQLAEAFTEREPFAKLPLTLAPLGQEYLFSGTPAFDTETGRFLGYRGVARPAPSDAEVHDLPKPPVPEQRARKPATTRNVESLRELVHEIKTPLNAIIGFAEIIDGQYLGPAHRGYRERAAEIVAQARILLGAIEDLDFAAREQADRAKGEGPDPDADIRSVIERAMSAIRPIAERRGVRIVANFPEDDHQCRLNEGLAERLVRRLFGAVLETLEDGETLFVEGARTGSHCQLRIARPAALKGLSAQKLLDPALTISGQGPALLGFGFSLRLVRGLVRIAGGELAIEPDRIVVHLPVAKP
ncbi:sensor histidine kinase [Sphingomicrobium clamense]|uniref:histidine kinase n=1 Tax=Sphingomicrobium clamense TaxID=2851013 RepID=A0ABS6V6B5_9SPHN|nr:HAMP domain-containing sensor histidine kinase [Sphingomicrobium sp. B8]MBW0145110.1 HAMP domain-containing histidine kinase [Sphingomicrobium sp. B8]